MKKKVVVFGGSGFLGTHIADELTAAGYAVTVFDLQRSQWSCSGQEMVVGDILNKQDVLEAVRGAAYVYHLAGLADINQAVSQPRATIEHNIFGSMNVIEACIEAKVERLLFASTVYVYSRQGSFYRISKQTVEALLETFAEQGDLRYTILRYGSLYGPRAQAWNGLKRFVTQAVCEGRIIYPGTGEERREYIHVKDAAQLSLKALEREYENKCLTITGSQVLTTKELVQMIKEIVGGELKLEFSQEDSHYEQFHYSLTPYRYTPKAGCKIVPNEFVDLGQGILDLVEEVNREH